jgi:glycosyltransferase involved in cell wall biosynthesis
MRILAVTNMYPSPASPSNGVFVHEQVKGLRAIGLEVRVLFFDRKRAGALEYYRMGGRIAEAVATFDPDVIHVMYGGVMADQIVRRHRLRPVILTFHGSDLLGENLSGWVRKASSRYGVYCSRRAAKAADRVILVARHLTNALGNVVSSDKIRVIPCGIDLKRFKPMDPLMCKRRLGWDPSSFHVLFASNNGDSVKRPWLAKAAVEQMNGDHGAVQLHYMTGISNTEVPLWLNASDALLLTSLHEGSPTIVKEALACGLPVVSVKVGDVAERIEGIEGCYLAEAQPPELAAKLSLVRQNGKRLNCRTQLEELSILHVAEKLKQCYEEITAVPSVASQEPVMA